MSEATIPVRSSNVSLPRPIREVVILTVGVAWQAEYEIYAHVAVARAVGLSETVIDGLRQGLHRGFRPGRARRPPVRR